MPLKLHQSIRHLSELHLSLTIIGAALTTGYLCWLAPGREVQPEVSSGSGPQPFTWAPAGAWFPAHLLQQSLGWIHVLPLDRLLNVLQLWLTVARILMRELLIY